MRFNECGLADVCIVEMTPHEDARGAFSRIYCSAEFAAARINLSIVQTNLSQNPHAKTLRGMHRQIAPHAEDKLICCVSGAIWDAIIDLRPKSPTFLRSFGIELTSANRRMLLVPKGFAHGFLTLASETTVVYQTSYAYTAGAERGYRWNDPAFNVEWPFVPEVISDKDRNWLDFSISEIAA